MKRIQALTMRNLLQHTLDEQLLAPVAEHNVRRAMCLNATHLGLTLKMLQDDIVSPFNVFSPSAFGTAELPPTLQPTMLQSQVIHHPWIDLFPIQSVRDAILTRVDAFDEDVLCHDLFFGGTDGNEPDVGIVIWGEPWDPSAYEFSEAVLRKWQWLLGGCMDAIHATNHWRSIRNKKPVRLLGMEPSHDGR